MEFVDEIKQKFSNTVHIKCETEVNTKIKQIVSDGWDKLQVISDFDRTITTSEDNNKPTLSSFAVFEMCDSVSDDFREIQRLILQKYRPVEDDPRMTVSEKLPWIEEWWDKSELSLKGQRFHYEDIEKSISKANLKLRSGTTEAFNKLSSLNVPIVVLSAGIGDVVKLILKHENLMTDNVTIVSNFLDVSKDDSTGVSTIHGYKGDKIIHVYNKNEHVYMDEHKNNTHLSGRSNVILLGDSLGDRNMDGDVSNTNVLRIGFFNNLVDHENKYLQQYKQAFDIVLVRDQTMGLFNYLLDKINVKKSVGCKII